MIARAMIGLGMAAALTAGLKSIVLWFPRERVALLNGYMVILGSLRAVTATVARALIDGSADPRGIEAWAAWAAVSERTFSRHFVEETGFNLRRGGNALASCARSKCWLMASRLIRSRSIWLCAASAFIALFRQTFAKTPATCRANMVRTASAE
jgi:AraC-like DNA-binding protein